MMLKKDMKMTGTKGRGGIDTQDDQQQEMNELIESDEEVNAADLDEDRSGAINNLRNNNNSSDDEGMDNADDDEEYEYDAEERSLVDSDEERG